ncbi:hypothetical protein [Methylopila turkensis]|uniref:Uncharacterized protein n=1 Tax=Methylopila turkensis TaxID=1437816 RepID=A0A9W6N669_9HYPH|nr:hypothetical protein [Methylopila turkensis]GLK79090.1 hypothetical protein GCM10008174_08310 [Methylopila turkensis]
MTKSQLRLTIEQDDTLTVVIHAKVTTSTFSGYSAAHFEPMSVRQTFVPALMAFPLSSDNPATLEGGFWKQGVQGQLDQIHLRVVVRPHGTRGAILVHTDVATEVWNGADVDLQQTCTARFLTSYEELNRFASALDQALGAMSGEVALSAMEL